MTSKEALNKLVNYIGRLGGGETQEWEDVILRDLERLEIFEKHLVIDKNGEVWLKVTKTIPEGYVKINIKEEE